MDDITAMDEITRIVEDRNGSVDADMHATGAIILSLYTSPNGDTTLCSTRIGGLNAYSQEGMLRSALRRLEANDEGWEDDE